MELVFDPLPPPDLSKLVEESVTAHTMAATATPDWTPVNYFLRTAEGDWGGGCLGGVWGGWLHVKFLWVAERLRGQGQGGRLLDAAEAHAKRVGAGNATLDTFNPRALGFYRARGYTVFGELPDWPPGFSRYYLRKTLAGQA